MAQKVSVEKFQQLQRGGDINANGDEIIDQATADAEAAEALRRIGAPVNRSGEQAVAEIVMSTPGNGQVDACSICGRSEGPGHKLDGYDATGDALRRFASSCRAESLHAEAEAPVEPKAEDRADMVVELQALGVAAGCSEEMTLGMVVDRVRYSAHMGGLEPTDAEIVAEAERIFGSFIDNRKGPREYDVIDGEVRDWRRPDTTPDRGDVTEVHTVTDDEPRFSGGGDGVPGFLGTYAVPTDAEFRGKLYRDAPDLANLATRLIESKEYFEHLLHCEIRYAWKGKSGTTKRRRQTGGLKRGSDWFGQLLGADFGIWLAADTARERRFSPRHVERYLTHQLLRIGQDDNGNFVEQAPTLQVFAPEITEYADVADEDLLVGRSAYQAAEQMGLFVDDVDESPENDGSDLDCRNCGGTVSIERPLTGGLCEACHEEQAEEAHRRDGAGVLIHADGTAMTDDEIEAMERHELDDAPAEDEDILADLPVI